MSWQYLPQRDGRNGDALYGIAEGRRTSVGDRRARRLATTFTLPQSAVYQHTASPLHAMLLAK